MSAFEFRGFKLCSDWEGDESIPIHWINLRGEEILKRIERFKNDPRVTVDGQEVAQVCVQCLKQLLEEIDFYSPQKSVDGKYSLLFHDSEFLFDGNVISRPFIEFYFDLKGNV